MLGPAAGLRSGKMDEQQRVAAYQQLFGGPEAAARLRTLALKGGLRSAGLRSVVWKVFLGLLPSSATLVDWQMTISANRKEYEAHKDAILSDPYKDGEDRDLLTNNPLAQAEDSSWKKYFELQELQKDIQHAVALALTIKVMAIMDRSPMSCMMCIAGENRWDIWKTPYKRWSRKSWSGLRDTQRLTRR